MTSSSALLGVPLTSRPVRSRWTPWLRPPRVSTAVTVVVATFLSLFPSYLPHGPALQGMVSGVFLLVGLGLVRRLRPRQQRLRGMSQRVGLLGASLAMAAALGWAGATQDAMRSRIGMPPLSSRDCVGTMVTASAVLLLARAARAVWRLRGGWRTPTAAVGVAVSVLLPIKPVYGAPTSTAALNQALLQSSPVGAVRTYAELRSGEDLRQRAERAADQLAAAGGLRRTHVVVMIPTGSGWVDQRAVAGLEQRFGSTVAMVAVQYASTPSWLAYLFDQDGAARGARAAFDAIAARVADLPVQQRPQLHVYGQSLGATAGQRIFTGPGGAAAASQVCSALWVGAPGGGGAGLPREASVANADDPIVHASLRTLVAPPPEHGPWLPVISMLQNGADLLGSLAVPAGAGHRYGPEQADALPVCDAS